MTRICRILELFLHVFSRELHRYGGFRDWSLGPLVQYKIEGNGFYLTCTTLHLATLRMLVSQINPGGRSGFTSDFGRYASLVGQKMDPSGEKDFSKRGASEIRIRTNLIFHNHIYININNVKYFITTYMYVRGNLMCITIMIGKYGDMWG